MKFISSSHRVNVKLAREDRMVVWVVIRILRHIEEFYILVMQRSRVGTPWNIPSAYNEKIPSNKWDNPCNTTRERCISILPYVKENAVANTIDETHAWSRMGKLDVIRSNIQRLSCIPIGCIFYSVVKKLQFCTSKC